MAMRTLLPLVALVEAEQARPHIISILQDDLGFWDSGIHNPEAVAWTGNISALAREGIVLQKHYTHWHCSPTRRSFLTGRLPIHHGEQLSGNDGDDIDLRMTWISQKLKSKGYKTHWFGKMHTGFRSWQHLAHNRGFDVNIGSLQTGGAYSGPKHSTRWQDDHPIWSDDQFTNKPAECGNVQALEQCSMAFQNDTKMACGSGYKFLNLDAAGCCAACDADSGCTHWVHNPAESGKPVCHLKSGNSDCSGEQTGATSGAKAPGPAPGSATCTNEYSTDLWGQLAVQAVEQHDASQPFYMHLCFQAVHSPYDVAPGDPTGNVYRGMLWRADVYIGELVAALKSKGMWENTLLVYAGDNGGVGPGNNYPLRGEKHSNWEGAMRVAAFVGGGFVPKALRGSNSSVNSHVVDWYPTFSRLAGADPQDDPPAMPDSVDLEHPEKNIYGNESFPPVDGIDLWPSLTQPGASADAVHKHLVLSKEVLIAGRYKLLVSQPHFKSQNSGWKQPNGDWEKSNDDPCINQDLAPDVSGLPVPAKGMTPCLYDLVVDPSERHNIAAGHPDIVEELWSALNKTIAGYRDCNGWSGPVKGPGGSCSPAELIGVCNKQCAHDKWARFGSTDGPICGVPGCDGDTVVV